MPTDEFRSRPKKVVDLPVVVAARESSNREGRPWGIRYSGDEKVKPTKGTSAFFAIRNELLLELCTYSSLNCGLTCLDQQLSRTW